MKNSLRHFGIASKAASSMAIVGISVLTVFAAGPSQAPTGGNVDANFNTVTTTGVIQQLSGLSIAADGTISSVGAGDVTTSEDFMVTGLSKATNGFRLSGPSSTFIIDQQGQMTRLYDTGNSPLDIEDANGMIVKGQIYNSASFSDSKYVNIGDADGLLVSNYGTNVGLLISSLGDLSNTIASKAVTVNDADGLQLSSGPLIGPNASSLQFKSSTGFDYYYTGAGVAPAILSIDGSGAMSNPGINNGGKVYVNDPSGFMATATANNGVTGASQSQSGVYASSDTGNGITATTNSGRGLSVSSGSGVGVYSTSTSNVGVWGISTSSTGVAAQTGAAALGAVSGNNTGAGPGVYGNSSSGSGVSGFSNTGTGVYGLSNTRGVYGYGPVGGEFWNNAGPGANNVKLGTAAAAVDAVGTIKNANLTIDQFGTIYTPAAADVVVGDSVFITGGLDVGSQITSQNGYGRIYTNENTTSTTTQWGSTTVSCSDSRDRILNCGLRFTGSGNIVEAGKEYALTQANSCVVHARNMSPAFPSAAQNVKAYVTCWDPDSSLTW